MQTFSRTNAYAKLRNQIEIQNLAHPTVKEKIKINRNKKLVISLCISFLCCCISLFTTIGSSYAWFTDSVSNTGNRVKAGTLDVDLLMYDGDKYVSIANGNGDIFAEANVAQNSNKTLWEPGKTQVVYLAVKNNGDLTLKYNIAINVTDGGLADSLECYVGDEIKDGASIGAWSSSLVESNKFNLGNALRNDATNGVLIAAPNGKLLPYSKVGDVETGIDYFAFAIHMKEDASADTMGKEIIFDVSVLATQCSEESDGYASSSYDSTSEFPTIENIKHITNLETLKYVISIGGKGVLENHISGIDEDIAVPKNIIIDMNGHNITFINDHKFNVDEGKTITLTNSSETPVDKVDVNVNERLIISTEDSSKFN